jgi:FdhD protein
MADMALVQEVPVWLEINGQHAVSWMCTPEKLEELVVGWLHGEGFIESRNDLQSLKPCAPDMGFWATIDPLRVEAVNSEGRSQVLASGCGAVSTLLADPGSITTETIRGEIPEVVVFRELFKQLFRAGERYKDTGGIHAAALVRANELITHAEDIGRHNAVDKVIGDAILADLPLDNTGLLVTGRISAELAFKASRTGLVFVATPSVPSTLAAEIARRSGMTLVGRAVSGQPHVHRPANPSTA